MQRTLGLLAVGLFALSAVAGPKPAPKESAPKASSAKSKKSIANLLSTRRVTVKFDKITLDQFVKYLRAAVGINIVVNKARIEKDGGDVDAIEITLNLTDVRALDAMKIALTGQELGLVVKGNVLMITSKKAALGKPVLKIYDVAALLIQIRDFPAPDINIYPSNYEPPEPPEPEITQNFESSDQLAELVRQFAGQGTWEDEGVNITVFRRHLFIRTYPKVHREVAHLLARLR